MKKLEELEVELARAMRLRDWLLAGQIEAMIIHVRSES